MGTYDGVEVFELVGSFLHYALSLKYNKTNTGLYRDDKLVVFSSPHCLKRNFESFFGSTA